MANSRELAQFASFVNFTGSSIGLTTQFNVSGISTFTKATIFDSTGYIQVPAGNTAQRTVTGISVTFGQIRYNTQLSQFEGFGAGDAWGSLGGVKDVDGDTFIRAESAAGEDEDKLEFLTNDTTRVVIDSSGQVGIGTTIANATLDVTGNVNIVGVSTFQNLIKLADDVIIRLGDGDDTDFFHTGSQTNIKTTSGQSFEVHTNAFKLKNQNDNESIIIANSDSSVDLYYDNSKKFETTGIGVSISSGAGLTATIAGPSNLIIDPGVVGDNTGIVRIKGDLFVDGTQTQINSTTLEIADFVIGIASTATTDILADGAGINIGPDKTFKYEHNSGTNPSLKSSENLNVASGKGYQIAETEVLNATTLGGAVVSSSLTSVGTLGSLNVSGAVGIADSIFHIGDTNTNIRFPATDTFTVETSGSERLRIDSSGRLGIGGNSIGSGLGVYLQRPSPNTTHFYEASDGTKKMITGVDSTNDYVKIGALSNHRLGLVANNGEKVSILPGGSVGIGITVPDALLHVKGTTGKLIVEDTNGAAFIEAKGGGTNASDDSVGLFKFVNTGYAGSCGLQARTASNGSNLELLFMSGQFAEAMRINESGNIGIGTDNPQGKLHVSDGANGLEFNPNSQNAVVSYNRVTSAYAPVGFQGSTVALRIGGVGTALQVDSAGKIGIGTDDPEEILHILGPTETISSRDGVTLQHSTATADADNGLPLVWSGYVGSGSGLQNYGLASICGRKENSNADDGAAYLQFGIGRVSGAIIERLRINSGGDLQRPKSLSQEVSTSVSSVSATSCGSFAKATYRSAYVIAQITQGSSYQVGRYLLIHDGTTVTTVEESAIATGDMLGTFEGVINGDNVEFRVTMGSASSATVITKIESIVV